MTSSNTIQVFSGPYDNIYRKSAIASIYSDNLTFNGSVNGISAHVRRQTFRRFTFEVQLPVTCRGG